MAAIKNNADEITHGLAAQQESTGGLNNNNDSLVQLVNQHTQ